MKDGGFRTQLAARRVEAGLTQGDLASRAGISRQALGLIEAGRSVPSTALALRLAGLLGRTVENLFSLEEARAEIAVAWAEAGAGAPSGGSLGRGILARIDERWVAHPLSPRDLLAADVLRDPGKPRGRARILPGPGLQAARERLVIAGCAPALGLLVDHLARASDPVHAVWLHATSEVATRQLDRGEIHLAGVHFSAHATARSRAGGGRRALTLAAWQEGLVVRARDRRAPRRIEDLAKGGLRLARRERGARANRLLEERLVAAGITLQGPSLEARGHFGVAQAVALGAADVAVAAQHAALAHGLDFIPLDEERFDLVFDPHRLADRRLERLVDVLSSRAFREDLAALGGYDTADTGNAPSGRG